MKPQRRAPAPRAAHVVETLEWRCRFDDRGAAWRHHQRLGDFLRGTGGAVIEALFSELSGPDEVWSIDHLELDLGALRPEASTDEWAHQLRVLLRAALLRLRGDRAGEYATATPKSATEQDLDDFLHYIHHGHLPWAHGALPGRDLAGWLARLARRDGIGLWRHLRASPAPAQTLARLTQITPHHGLQALLASRNAELAASLELLDAELLAPLRRRVRIGDYAARQLQQEWRGAALIALWDHDGGRLGADRIARLLRTLRASIEARIGAGWRSALPAATVAPRGELARALWQGLVAPMNRASTPAPDTRSETHSVPDRGAMTSPVARAALAQLQAALDGSRPLTTTRWLEMLDALRAWQPGPLRQRLADQAQRRAARVRWVTTLPAAVLGRLLQALSVDETASSSGHDRAAAGPWQESLRQFALARLSLASAELRALGVSRVQALLAAYLLRHLAEGGALPRDHRAWQALWWRGWQAAVASVSPASAVVVAVNPSAAEHGAVDHAAGALPPGPFDAPPASESSARSIATRTAATPTAADSGIDVDATTSRAIGAASIESTAQSSAPGIRVDGASSSGVVEGASVPPVFGGDGAALDLAPRAFVGILIAVSAAPVPRRALLAAYVRGQQQASRKIRGVNPAVLRRHWRQALLSRVRQAPATLSLADLAAQRQRWQQEARDGRVQPALPSSPKPVVSSPAFEIPALVDDWLAGAVVYEAEQRWQRAQRLQPQHVFAVLQQRLQQRSLRRTIADRWPVERKLELLQRLSATPAAPNALASDSTSHVGTLAWLPAMIEAWAAQRAASRSQRVDAVDAASAEAGLWLQTMERMLREPAAPLTPAALQAEWRAAEVAWADHGAAASETEETARWSGGNKAPSAPTSTAGRASGASKPRRGSSVVMTAKVASVSANVHAPNSWPAPALAVTARPAETNPTPPTTRSAEAEYAGAATISPSVGAEVAFAALSLPPRAFVMALITASAAPVPRRALLAAYVRGQQQASDDSRGANPAVLRRHWRQALLTRVRQAPATLGLADLAAQRQRWQQEARDGRVQPASPAPPKPAVSSPAFEIAALVDDWLAGAVVDDADPRWQRAQRLQPQRLRALLLQRLRHHGLRREIASRWPQTRPQDLLQLLSGMQAGAANPQAPEAAWQWLPQAIADWAAAHQAAWPQSAAQTDAAPLPAWLWLRTLDLAVREPDQAMRLPALQAEWRLAWASMIADRPLDAPTAAAPPADETTAAGSPLLLQRWLAFDAPALTLASRLALLERLSEPSAAAQLHALDDAAFARLLQRVWPRLAPKLSAMLNALATATSALLPALDAKARAALLRQHTVQHLFIEGLDAEPAALARRYALWLRRREVSMRGAASVSLQRWLQRLDATLTTDVRPADRPEAAVQQALRRPVNASEQWQAAQPLPATEGGDSDAAAAPPSPVIEPRVGEPIAIANAGLVLLVAYAQRLFERLELSRDGAFVDAAARHAAIHSLAYLSDGHCEGDESGWMLNKLLCGVAIAEPVPRCPEFDEARRALLDGLLQAVIANWGALGQTSVEGLRVSFLRREGRLLLQDGEHGRAWQLQVDRRGYDVLLDRLPWGYGTIKLPWMAEAIHVKWR